MSRSRLWSSRWLAFVLVIMAPVAAQEKAPPAAEAAGTPAAEEAPFLSSAAKDLDAFATLSLKNGYPKRAREVWLEVVGEYAPDDAVAREQLGYLRQGTVWLKDPNHTLATQDVPNATVARMLTEKWEALARRLADGHRTLAQQLEAAGRKERAQYHFDRVLRFAPADAKAGAARGVKQFEGVSGSELELEILRRSRLMDRAVTKLTDAKYEVKPVPADRTHPVLVTGGVKVNGFQSENFTVFGDFDDETLKQACQHAERSLAFCREAFGGYEEWASARPMTKTYAYLKTKAVWADVVRKNESAIGKDRAEFVAANASALDIGAPPTGIYLSGFEDQATVYDHAVRKTAEQYARVGCDALKEGIGHAVVAMFFGRNLIFSVGQMKKEGTVAGKREDARLLMPDADTWAELATEIAWQKTNVPSARLPLLKAAQFPSDGRIMAWSFCDYLLRRDPRLLLHLDRTSAKARTEADVRQLFLEYGKQPLDGLETDWRQFWTTDTPAKRALAKKATPLESVSKEAPDWLSEFNALRDRLSPTFDGGKKLVPLGWSASLSTDCKQHVEYLKKNKDQRGADKENTQLAGKPGFSNAGRSFAEVAIVWTQDKEPKKAMESWWLLPGYRDVLLNPNIDTLGLFAEGSIVAIEGSRGRSSDPENRSAFFPFVNVQGGRYRDPVPAAVDTALLGAEAVAILRQAGQDKQKQIGFPITLHTYTTGMAGETTCSVSTRGTPIPGALSRPSIRNRRTSAPGMWVFWPFAPLPKGVDIDVAWKYPSGEHKVTFVAQ